MMKNQNKKAILLILDGFGYSEKKEHNAIEKAHMPNWKKITSKYPMSLIKTSGEAVGLPRGVMGNSEVGHITIGAGRVFKQDLVRINDICNGAGFDTLKAIQDLSNQPGCVHLMGLVSDGGVHSDISHLIQLIKSIHKTNPQKEIYLHAFLDGRDTPPKSSKGYIENLSEQVKEISTFKIATIVGRFYAMDRDQRWERVEEAYKAMTSDFGKDFVSAIDAIEDAYQSEETDEFVKARRIRGVKRIENKDLALFFNFRADRAREISEALTSSQFSKFKTSVQMEPQNFFTMTQYQEDFEFPVLFPKESPKQVLGELASSKGVRQLRIAETEKYAHVTYFLNGGVEDVFEGEERILVPSPKEVDTYDEKPEMSLPEVTTRLVSEIQKNHFELIVANFANGDMVGHTGNEKAAIEACEAIDQSLGKVLEAAKSQGYDLVITADHGNCEQMIDEDSSEAFTQHTTNPVPLVWVGKMALKKKLLNGGLSDIAPTIIDILGWKKPIEMTGQSLIG